MHHQSVETERLGAVELLDQTEYRLAAKRRIRPRDIDQIAVVRQDRTDLGLANAAAEERDLLRWQFTRAPLAAGLGEDLQRAAAAGFRAVDRARQAAVDRQMRAE